MDFLYPVTKIFIIDKNNVSIGEFTKTLKNKNVNVKIKRDEVKIKRGYTFSEKKLLTKQNVKAEFSIMCDFYEFKNLFDMDAGYSGNVYDIKTATKNGIIYPSLDPSIFEIKYPNSDITGRVVKP